MAAFRCDAEAGGPFSMFLQKLVLLVDDCLLFYYSVVSRSMYSECKAVLFYVNH